MPDPTLDHAKAIANTGIRLVRYLTRRSISHPHQWYCRIGLSTGSVFGSVVGIQKYVYDVFGPTVNLAPSLQELAEPMQLRIQDDVANVLKHHFDLEHIGEKAIRGFGYQTIWQLSDTD